MAWRCVQGKAEGVEIRMSGLAIQDGLVDPPVQVEHAWCMGNGQRGGGDAICMVRRREAGALMLAGWLAVLPCIKVLEKPAAAFYFSLITPEQVGAFLIDPPGDWLSLPWHGYDSNLPGASCHTG